MRLAQTVFGLEFQNPVLLASGTCGYGAEFDEFFDIDDLGGLVIKAVTADARPGNPAPRVAEFHAGMINSVGLANPGPDVVLAEKLPWLARRVSRAPTSTCSWWRPRSRRAACPRSRWRSRR